MHRRPQTAGGRQPTSVEEPPQTRPGTSASTGAGGDGAAAPPLAVVIGSDCIEVVRSLALAGVRCGVIAPRLDAARFSRHARRIFDWEWGEPVERHGEQLLERFLEFGARQPSRPVLFFCDEQSVVFTSRNRTRLAPYFRFAIPSAELIEDVSDKARFTELSRRRSLPVPTTRVIESSAELLGVDNGSLDYPVIVKPTLRDDVWQGMEEAKAIRIDTAAEFRLLANRFAGSGLVFLVQQFVEGPESAIESYHVYVDGDGRVRGEFTGRKIRTLPAEYGDSTALESTSESDVRDLGRRLVESLGIRGVAKFDFKRSTARELYLLEINPRFSLWHHLGARIGVNLPALVYSDLTGRPVRTSSPAQPSRATWVHPKDLVAARRAGVPVAQWVSWAARCKAKAFWAWDDPLPLVATATARMRDRLGRPPRGRPGTDPAGG
jgi:D-aspartate ligase